MVAIERVADAIAATIGEMDVDKKAYSLVGPSEGRAYVLRFNGVAGLAAKRVGKFLALQRAPNDEWRSLDVQKQRR